jgi:ABC-2 type transport system permease protein
MAETTPPAAGGGAIPGAPAGSIYDIGYRAYSGPRLGRAHAIRALYTSSLKGLFGIGRSGRSKIAPFTLAALMLLPALAAVAFDVLIRRAVGQSPSDQLFESPIQYGTYLGLILTLLILFCAAQAPELVGRDQRHRVLVLYFSRALERADYALAKLGAIVTALILVYAAPLLLMFVGRIFAGSDVPTALVENVQDVAPAVLVAPAMAFVLGGISLAAAALTPRRAYATAGIIAIFIIPPIVIAVAQEVARGAVAQYVVLIGPAQVLDGVNAFLFGRPPGDEMVQFARLPGPVYVATAVVMAAASIAVVLRRYQKIET